jgi:hypothetical protein
MHIAFENKEFKRIEPVFKKHSLELNILNNPYHHLGY